MLHQGGKKPQRGFGGRLIFYGEDNEKPVLVDGQLVVYAFDESNREATDNKPTRRYVFPADQVARRMSKSELGPSYSFWLPWDEVGGPQTEISLIPRFEPKEGPIVIGEQTKHLLAGRNWPEDGDRQSHAAEIAGWDSRAAGNADARRTCRPGTGMAQVRCSWRVLKRRLILRSNRRNRSTATAAGGTDSARTADDDNVDLAAGEFPRSGSPVSPAAPRPGEIELSNNRFAHAAGAAAELCSGRRADQRAATGLCERPSDRVFAATIAASAGRLSDFHDAAAIAAGQRFRGSAGSAAGNVAVGSDERRADERTSRRADHAGAAADDDGRGLADG